MVQAAAGDRPETLEEHLAAGGDRRSFIKKIAAAGTAAWVAPLIAGAVLSPAAASGPQAKRLRYCYNQNGFLTQPTNGCTLPTPFPPSCTPTGWDAAIDTTPAAAGITPTSGASSDVQTFTLTGGCTFTAVTGRDKKDCGILGPGVLISSDRRSVTVADISLGKGFPITDIYFVLSC